MLAMLSRDSGVMKKMKPMNSMTKAAAAAPRMTRTMSILPVVRAA